ncbi:MAG: DJ-1/PfpI family protein [Mycoplasmatales bacterium]|nr:DJ-1/PfpI family protein [Mycoplasmatales bacterium]
MKNILVPVQTGYEETELITTLNILFRNKINYTLWSVEGLDTVKSSHEAFVKTKQFFPAEKHFDAIFIPGGPAVKDLLEYDEIIHLVKKFNEENKIIASICAGPEVLLKAGVLEGKKYTAHPEFANGENKLEKTVVANKNIVSGKDYEATVEFANKLVQELNN